MTGWDEVETESCYYCGVPATTIDHVVPKSLLTAVRASGEDGLIAAVEDRRRRMVVPACRECNQLAGAKYHHTLAERADYVRARLAQRHRKALSLPDWAPSELMSLSEHLRLMVVAALLERDAIRRRLRYRPSGRFTSIPDDTDDATAFYRGVEVEVVD